MGMAKKRGTLEQRIEQAREKFEAGIEVQRKEVAELDAMEKRQMEALGNFVTNVVAPQMDRQHGALMRADYTLIPLPITRAAQQ